jgi:uncharacterized membrane protein HdeD (DUF308 family)
MASRAAGPSVRRDALASANGSLRSYYALRATVAALWAATALAVGNAPSITADILLVSYPAWDALANLLDARRNGGLGGNKLQAVNVAVSAAIAAAVAVSLGTLHVVLGLFGGWAILAGLLQLAVGIRRWRLTGAQWAMVLSGAQSALAGGFFISQAFGTVQPGVATLAPYALFGAFYFLLSAIGLTIRRRR